MPASKQKYGAFVRKLRKAGPEEIGVPRFQADQPLQPDEPELSATLSSLEVPPPTAPICGIGRAINAQRLVYPLDAVNQCALWGSAALGLVFLIMAASNYGRCPHQNNAPLPQLGAITASASMVLAAMSARALCGHTVTDQLLSRAGIFLGASEYRSTHLIPERCIGLFVVVNVALCSITVSAGQLIYWSMLYAGIICPSRCVAQKAATGR